jgi:ABC-type Fe3+-hydroxamate transport system substrate-binding protein
MMSRVIFVSRAAFILCGLLHCINGATAQGTDALKPAIPIAAKRIVTAAPSLTELVYAVGAGDKLVAVSTYSDYPKAALQLPQIAAWGGLNIEAVLSHRPDLVLVWTSGTREADIATLKKLGIRVEAIGIARLDDVPAALRRVGELTGQRVAAKAAANTFQTRLAALKPTGRAGLKVLIEIGEKPQMSVNGAHFISDAVSRCGGVNIFANAPQLVFTPSREEILQRMPAVILRPQSARQKQSAPPSADEKLATPRVLRIHADYLLRPGPRLIDAAEAICAAL